MCIAIVKRELIKNAVTVRQFHAFRGNVFNNFGFSCVQKPKVRVDDDFRRSWFCRFAICNTTISKRVK